MLVAPPMLLLAVLLSEADHIYTMSGATSSSHASSVPAQPHALSLLIIAMATKQTEVDNGTAHAHAQLMLMLIATDTSIRVMLGYMLPGICLAELQLSFCGRFKAGDNPRESTRRPSSRRP